MAIAQHIMLRLRDSRVIASTPAERRRLARTILRIGRAFGLLAFGVPDTHAHIEAVCNRAEASEFGRRVEISFTKGMRLPVGFAPAYITPVHDQHHLGNVCHYCLRQAEHHGVAADPYFDATNLPDLLGMRVNGSYTRDNLRRFLPRITESQLGKHLGRLDLQSATPVLRDLQDAAAGAFALEHLRGSAPDAVAARIAAVHVALEHWPLTDIADALEISTRSVRRLRACPAQPGATRAVRGQLGLRAARRAHDIQPFWLGAITPASAPLEQLADVH